MRTTENIQTEMCERFFTRSLPLLSYLLRAFKFTFYLDLFAVYLMQNACSQ